MLIDIGKAHLCAPIEEKQYVDLPPERASWEKCPKLLFTLYIQAQDRPDERCKSESRNLECRAEGEDRNGLGQRGERVLGL